MDKEFQEMHGIYTPKTLIHRLTLLGLTRIVSKVLGNSGEKSHSVDSTEVPIYFLFHFILF